jgi:MFS family permease
MATYFASARHWNPAQVGLILAAQKFASVLAQAPAGSAIDRTKFKRALMAGAALAIGLGALLTAVLKTIGWQIANQIMVGISTAIATPLIAAISLGIVGRRTLGHRIGRNESFNHGGNLLTASLAGYLGYAVGLQWIFYVCGALGIVCAGTALLVRKGDIDDDVAREAPENPDAATSELSVREAITKPLVLTFAIVVLLFHIANAAMLPLIGQELPGRNGHSSPLYMSAAIVVAQFVMIPVAFVSGRLADRIGRKPILLAGFGALVLRGLLFSVSRSPDYLVGIEALDGIGTGISGVLTVLVISDLANGTGRFNFMQGAMQACLGMGSFLGNLLAGLAAKSFGFSATFIGLSTVAFAGLLFLAVRMPETLRSPPVGSG